MADPFHRLNLILDNPNASIDEKLDGVCNAVRETFPELLEHTKNLSDDEIETLFVRFTVHQDAGINKSKNTLLALAAAAELKIRAKQAGITAMEYAERIRERRELNDG